MHSKLSVQSSDIGFFLSVPLEQRRLLGQKFAQVANQAEWPPGTVGQSDWRFTCNVFALDNKTYPAFEFDYIDYAGGVLTNPGLSDEIEAEAESADALLGIIDGHKLIAEMDSGVAAPEGTPLGQDLESLLPIMAHHTAPVHLIISKWDLFHNKYSLREARDRLLKYPGFESLVRLRVRQETPIRLIPVSSVGMGFTELQDGEMQKIPGAVPHPFQVEMPIAHVLLDNLQARIKELERQETQIVAQPVQQATQQLSWWAALKAAGAGALQKVHQRLPLDYQFALPVLSLAVNYLEAEQREAKEAARTRAERLRREREQSLRQVQDQQTAIEYTWKSFMALMNKLREDFPDSDLSRP